MSYQLDLFEDEDGLWRCGGRLAKRNLPYSVIYPYFIPKEHYFAVWIILKNQGHFKDKGVRGTINNLREELCQKFKGPCYDYPKLGPLDVHI